MGLCAGCFAMFTMLKDLMDPKGPGRQQYRDRPEVQDPLKAFGTCTRSTYSIEPKWGRGAVASPYLLNRKVYLR